MGNSIVEVDVAVKDSSMTLDGNTLKGFVSCTRVIPYQFTEVLHITLSDLDETWYVGSPGGLM